VWSAHPEVPDRVRAEIAIATGEIAANIIEYAGRGRTTQLRMEFAVPDDEVQVRLIDDGHRMDVELEAVVMPDVTAERGRGLALARAVLRHLSYERTGESNQWTLLSERFSR
jgi:serine/threonine-protein kinase RsbW